MKNLWLARVESIVLLAGSLLFAASLGLYAYAGSFARYWADDYCYSAWVKYFGLIDAIRDWYQTSGNRLSTLIVVALSEGFGPLAIRFVPLAVLGLWVGAWVFCLWRVSRRLGLRIAPLAWLWLALVQVYFVTLLAPDRLQTIYWRMGVLHYSLPLPLLLINLGLLAWAAGRSGRGAAWFGVGSGLLAFFAAGLSETFAAMQAGLYGLALAAVLWRWIRQPRSAARSTSDIFLTAAPLVSSLLMLVIMSFAPANAWRQAVMPPPDNLWLIIPYSLRYALDFIFFTIRGRLVPYGLYALGMAAFALLVWRSRTAPRQVGMGLVVTLLATYFLIVCSFAPSAYAGLAYPAGRAQMPAAFVLLAGLGLMAGLGAHLVRGLLYRLPSGLLPERLQPGWTIAALLLLAAFSLYPLRLSSLPRQDQAQLAPRAARWDARDAQIRAALAGGLTQVTVQQTDVVQTLEDIGPDPGYWINICAAMYYGAATITANP